MIPISHTSQTANLSLNQWSLGDFVDMADFNADNRKIDAAYAAVNAAIAAAQAANPTRLLFSVTTTAAVSQIDLDFTSVNTGDYVCFEVYSELIHEYVSSVPSSTTYFGQGRLNGISSGYKTSGSSATESYLFCAGAQLLGSSEGYAADTCTMTGVGYARICCQTSLAPGRVTAYSCLPYFMTTNHGSRELTLGYMGTYSSPLRLSSINLLLSSGSLQPGSWVRVYGIRR